MGKSWRLTAVFGILFAVCAALYFFLNPTETTPIEKLDPRVLALSDDQVSKIEVDRKDGSMTFEKASDAAGEYWRMAGPASHAADPALVQQMLYGLGRFLKAGAIDPQQPEALPERTGLADPRLTVAFVSAAGREVLKFGKSPATNTTVVCYQHQGDPRVYLVGVDTFEAFNKPPLQYRAKALARFAPHRINKVVLEAKFLRAQGKGKPAVPEYERSVMERFEEGLERGWYLTEPHRERLDDHTVAGLVTELSRLDATDYQPAGRPQEQGFDLPEAKFSVYTAGEDQPVEIQFGATAEREKKRWVRLAGAGEVGLCDAYRFDELPHQRNHLRVRAVFAFTHELVRKLEIEVQDQGRVVLERRETKKPDEVVSTSKWVVVEPEGLHTEPERLEAFVIAVVSQQVDAFLGAQNFKQARLDPAPIRLKIETREGKTYTCGFSPAGYLRKDDLQELFQVRPEYVRMLQKLELNFVNPDMFNVPRQSLVGFEFESRASAQLLPLHYRMEQHGGKPWVFTDAGHHDAQADPEKVANLMTMMNFIRAESLLGRDPAIATAYGLNESTAPATLTILHETGDEKNPKTETTVLYISEDKSDKPTLPLYYARLKDNPTVFQISGLFVATLKQVPALRKEAPEEKGK